jgi:hypothetical protein
MKKCKFKIRATKNSHTCVPLSPRLLHSKILYVFWGDFPNLHFRLNRCRCKDDIVNVGSQVKHVVFAYVDSRSQTFEYNITIYPICIKRTFFYTKVLFAFNIFLYLECLYPTGFCLCCLSLTDLHAHRLESWRQQIRLFSPSVICRLKIRLSWPHSINWKSS